MAMIKEDAVVCMYDTETGEVIDTIGEGDQYKIIRKETLDYLRETIEVNKNRDFTMIWNDVGKILCRERLTPNESAIIFGILGHIEYESGVLKMLCGCKPDKLLNAKDIMRICEMDDSSYYRAIKSLTQRKIIGQTKVGREVHFIVNPFIFYRGKKRRIPRTTYELFKDSKWNTEVVNK